MESTLHTPAATEPPPGFDPFDQAFLDDPHPIFRLARETAPVFYDPGLDMWVVSGYELVRQVFKDTDHFSAAVALEPIRPWCREALEIIQSAGLRVPPLLANADPPDHQVNRRFLGAPFARSAIVGLEPMVEEVVDLHLQPLIDRPEFDLVRDVTWQIPVDVLLRFLGVGTEDVATIKRWTASRVRLVWGHPDDAEQIELATSMAEALRYAKRFVEYKRQHPGDDYTSALLQGVEDEGRPPEMVRAEIAANIFNLLSAGHETTTAMMTNAVRMILADRTLWDRLRDEPGVADAIVEEAIRLEPSITTWRRRAVGDVEVDGVTIPAGATVLLSLAGANRDPARFADPDLVDLEREHPRDHLTFGFGIHHCLGAQLARMEIRELLVQLVARFPTLEAVEGQPLTYIPNITFRALENFLVRRPEAGR